MFTRITTLKFLLPPSAHLPLIILLPQAGAIILIHDFPFKESEETYVSTLTPIGIMRVLEDVQVGIGTDLAVFEKLRD